MKSSSKLRKIVSSLVLLAFIFQQAVYAYSIPKAPSTLATSSINDKDETPTDLETKRRAILQFALGLVRIHQDNRPRLSAELTTWVNQNPNDIIRLTIDLDRGTIRLILAERFGDSEEERTIDVFLPPAGNTIASGYSIEEEARIERDIRERSDNVRDSERNRHIVREAVHTCGQIRTRFTGEGILDGLQRDGIITQREREALENQEFLDALDNPEDPERGFCWFYAYVEGEERYYMGSRSSLAVNLMGYLRHREAQTGQRDRLLEYVMHEALEKTDLLHHEIIALTTKLLHPRDVGKAHGELPLGMDLREFINRDYVASRIALLTGQDKDRVWGRIIRLDRPVVDRLLVSLEESRGLHFSLRGEAPSLHTPEELHRHQMRNASRVVSDWPLIVEIRRRARTYAKITREEIDQLISFRYYGSSYVRQQALSALELIAKKGPDIISNEEMETLRLVFAHEDIKEDFTHIMNAVRENPVYVEGSILNVCGERISHEAVVDADIQPVGGGGMKRQYKVILRTGDGKEFTLAMAVFKEGRTLGDVMGEWGEEDYVVNIERGILTNVRTLGEEWKDLCSLPEKIVPMFGAVATRHGESLSIKVGPRSLSQLSPDVAVLSCEFVDGPTLKDVLADDGLSSEEKQRHLDGALGTVVTMWDHGGVFIGDPDPSNFMYSEKDQRCLITDLDVIRRGDLGTVVRLLGIYYPRSGDMVQRAVGERAQSAEGMCRALRSASPFVAAEEEAATDVFEHCGTPQMPLVAIGDHPDDIEYGMGGTLRRLEEEGRTDVHWAVLTTGADTTGVLDEQIIGHEQLSREQLNTVKRMLREGETRKSAERVGTPGHYVKFFCFGSGTATPGRGGFEAAMGRAHERELIGYLKGIAKGLPAGAPIAVAWHISEDPHAHHVYSAGFVEGAVRKFVDETGHPVYTMRYKLLPGGGTRADKPNLYLFMDSERSDAKDELMRCHLSQIQRRIMQRRFQTEGTIVEGAKRKDEEIAELAREQHGELPLPSPTEFSRAECFWVSQVSPATPVTTIAMGPKQETTSAVPVGASEISLSAPVAKSYKDKVAEVAEGILDPASGVYSLDEIAAIQQCLNPEEIQIVATDMPGRVAHVDTDSGVIEVNALAFGTEGRPFDPQTWTPQQEAFLRNQIIHELDHLLVAELYRGHLNPTEQEVVVLARESARLDQSPADRGAVIDICLQGEEKREENNLIDAHEDYSHPYLNFITGTGKPLSLADRVQNAIAYIRFPGLYQDIGSGPIDVSRAQEAVTQLAEGIPQRNLADVYASTTWGTAEDALKKAKTLAHGDAAIDRAVEMCYPRQMEPTARFSNALWGWMNAVIMDIDAFDRVDALLGNAQPGAMWTVLRRGNRLLLVAENRTIPEEPSGRYSTPVFLRDLIDRRGCEHVGIQPHSTAGSACMHYTSENQDFLSGFFRQVREGNEPVLLRVPYEYLRGLTEEQLATLGAWLKMLNRAENVFIEIYTMKRPKAFLKEDIYALRGLTELFEKNRKMPEQLKGNNRSRSNTVTLLLSTRTHTQEQFQDFIERNPSVEDSILVPIARPVIGTEGRYYRGDFAGLIRGTVFGFQRVAIVRNPADQGLRQRACALYQELIRAQGAPNFTFGLADLEALDSTDVNRRASALMRLAAALPEEESIRIEEGMQIYRHSEIAVGESA